MSIKHNKIIKTLKDKYQLNIINKSTLKYVFSIKLSPLNVFTYVGVSIVFFSIIVGLLFIYTPLNLMLPRKANSQLSRQLIDNAIKMDSLKKEIWMRDRYFKNIQNIMHGKQVTNIVSISDSLYQHEKLEFTRSKHDSILRRQIEKEEQQSLSIIKSRTGVSVSLKNIHFFVPVKGIVTNKFNAETGHLGTDIVAEPNEPILSVLDGTVTLATWSLTEGYIISIQHAHNIVSIYKHNSTLLKNVGDHVTAGEPITIIGNTGELTTGPHLHFELWYNGTAINPEDYINF